MVGGQLYRIALLVGVVAVLQIHGQKILSSKKRCGDPQCESLMMRASAKQDYIGPDCRFLSFRAGEEINVYYKLAEGREDLWQGSTGKAYGFFPRDVVVVEEVYRSEEVEVPAQEIDFVCLDGGEYFFENEDSVLHSPRENEEDFKEHTGGGISTEDLQHNINLKEPAEEVTNEPSGIAGWFGMGRTKQDKHDNTAKTENIEEEGAEQFPEHQGVQPKEPEDSQPENAGWFGGRLKGLLPFGGKNKQDEMETSSVTSQSASEESAVETEKENSLLSHHEAEQENQESKNTEEVKSKWFNFAIKDVLSFGAKNEKRKEDPSQGLEDTEGSEIPRQLSSSESNSKESDPEPKTETPVDDRPTMEETKLEEELELDNNVKHSTVCIEPDKCESDGSTVDNTGAPDQQELIKIQDKEKNIQFQENSEVPNPVKADHEPKPWFKSIVSNVMNLGKGNEDQVKTEGARIGEINPDNGLSDTPNNNQNVIPGESELSIEIHDATKTHPDTLTDEIANGAVTQLGNGNKTPMEKSTMSNVIHLEDGDTSNLFQEKDKPVAEIIDNIDPNLILRQEILSKTDKELNIKANIDLSSVEEVDLATGSSSPHGMQKIRHDRSNDEKVSGQCGSGEQSTDGHCTVPQGSQRSVHSTDEPCDNVVRKALAYPPLPSAAETAVFLKKVWLQCHDLYKDIIVPVRSTYTGYARKVVTLLPEDLQPRPDFHGCSWEVVIFTALLGAFSILAFTCRTVRCIKSRCYASRESKLGEQFAEILNSKSEVLEKLSLVQKQYDEVHQTLQESEHQKLLEEIAEQKALQETLQTSNRELEENITRLEQEVEEEKERGSELDNMLSDLNEKIKALEDSLKNEKSLKEEIRTTQKVFEITQGRMESSVRDAVEEQAHLRESIKQLSKEAEGWEERFSELSENSKMLNSSVQVMQEDLSSRQSQVKSLIDSLLMLKDWSSEVEDISNEDDEDGVLASIKWDFENGEPLGDPQKKTIKKLIFAAMLNASLKSVESEKKQLYENLSDEMKAKEHFSECITNLHNTNQSLSLEKRQLEEEVEKMKQKMSVMMEVYQENERKLHRKLTVQEKERLQKEAKLNKADEKVSIAATELITVKTRLTELEEETERTVASYQAQATSYEKKSHDNWLTARAAERYLSDVKRETLHLRQKLTEAEYKLELLEKDPFALDVIQAIGRESSPYGLSPISRVPESRAFLSPPTLLEGPLRLSPMLPTGDRGMRPPGYYPGYPGPKERSDMNADRKSDHQRTLSDAGSLSPPWDREQKNNAPPPGLPYPEHHFPPRRPDRYYHYPPPSGRFSGPAELTRNQGKPFADSLDGRSSPEYRSRGNTSRHGPEEAANVPGAPTMEGEAMDGPPTDYPMHPPPPMRVPLLPMDPRAPYFRRPFPMPPPPMDMYGPPGYPGLPPPHITMRGPLPPPPQRYPYPLPHEAFYPPQHPHQPPHNDHPSETQPAPPPPPPSDSTSHNLHEAQT